MAQQPINIAFFHWELLPHTFSEIMLDNNINGPFAYRGHHFNKYRIYLIYNYFLVIHLYFNFIFVYYG